MCAYFPRFILLTTILIFQFLCSISNQIPNWPLSRLHTLIWWVHFPFTVSVPLYPTFPTLPQTSNSTPLIQLNLNYPILPHPFHYTPPTTLYPTHSTLPHPSHYTPSNIWGFIYLYLRRFAVISNIKYSSWDYNTEVLQILSQNIVLSKLIPIPLTIKLYLFLPTNFFFT